MQEKKKQEYLPLTKIPIPEFGDLPGVDNSKVRTVIPIIKRTDRLLSNQEILARREERKKKKEERRRQREARRKGLRGLRRWLSYCWF
jgi:hypothetical protein